MRIDELRLIAFGPFTETILDMRGGKEGFHLIYGPNEAGKSSALRALKYMLYGIPQRSTDNFIHPYSKMRLGAVIRSLKGDVFEFYRRKGRGHTLRGANDKSILDETELTRCLSGVNSDIFATMFGIGHEDLVRGGQEIIKGGGDVGRLIFSAGSGILNLREVQNELLTETDQLFRPSGQKQKINKALSQIKIKRQELKEAQLPGQKWEQHDEALRHALKRKKTIEGDLNKQQKELSRLQRINKALPFIAKRKRLCDELKEYTSAILLPEDFPQKRSELITSLRNANKEKLEAEKNILSLNKNISEYRVSTEFIDNAEFIEEIHREHGSQLKAAKDRIALETERDTLKGEAKGILLNLRDDLTLDKAEHLRIKKSHRVRIQKFSEEYERLITRIEDRRYKLPGLIKEIDQIDNQQKALGKKQPIDTFKLDLQEASKYVPIEKQNRSELTKIKSAFKKIDQDKIKLGLAGTSNALLEEIPVPLPETIHDFENRFETSNLAIAETKKELKKTKNNLAKVERELKTYGLEQDVPTEIDLKKAREFRDKGWSLIFRELKEEPVAKEEVQDYLKTTPHLKNIYKAFEASLNEADVIADRLRREAERVAAKSRLIVDQDSLRENIEELERDLEASKEGQSQIKYDWEKIWAWEKICQSTGIKPRTPREMEGWLRDFQTLMEKVDDIDERRLKAEELKQDIEDQKIKIIDHINKIGTDLKTKSDSFGLLIKSAQAIIVKEEKLLKRHEELKRDKTLKNKDLVLIKAELETNENDLKQWQNSWEDALRPIGLEAKALPAEAIAVMEDIKSLFDKLKDSQILQKRIQGIMADDQDFKRKVKGLSEVIAKDLIEKSADEAALELYSRLKKNRDFQSKQETLAKQLKKEQKREQKAKKEISLIETRLKGMCEEADCKDIDELPEFERRSKKRGEIERGLKRTNEGIEQLSGGATVEEFVSQATTVDPDSITSRTEEAKEVIENLYREKSELDQSVGSQQTELSKMDGSSRAADLSNEIQISLGGLEKDVEHYARVKIATKLLSMAIARYRDKSQGPILKNASFIFNKITCGSFKGIRAEFDDKGDLVIVGVREKNEEIVQVQGMSDGTADQLYLALRLSGLTIYMENNEPIPFIVDDILIKFDNDRALATLGVLSKISEKTQLIFFTHHHHLVEMAKENVSSSVLFHHML